MSPERNSHPASFNVNFPRHIRVVQHRAEHEPARQRLTFDEPLERGHGGDDLLPASQAELDARGVFVPRLLAETLNAIHQPPRHALLNHIIRQPPSDPRPVPRSPWRSLRRPGYLTGLPRPGPAPPPGPPPAPWLRAGARGAVWSPGPRAPGRRASARRPSPGAAPAPGGPGRSGTTPGAPTLPRAPGASSRTRTAPQGRATAPR